MVDDVVDQAPENRLQEAVHSFIGLVEANPRYGIANHFSRPVPVFKNTTGGSHLTFKVEDKRVHIKLCDILPEDKKADLVNIFRRVLEQPTEADYEARVHAFLRQKGWLGRGEAKYTERGLEIIVYPDGMRINMGEELLRVNYSCTFSTSSFMHHAFQALPEILCVLTE